MFRRAKRLASLEAGCDANTAHLFLHDERLDNLGDHSKVLSRRLDTFEARLDALEEDLNDLRAQMANVSGWIEQMVMGGHT